MRKKKKASSSGGSNWLVTYSDLMTLLLAFFVLLFSMSSIEELKFTQMMDSIQNALMGKTGPTIFNELSETEQKLLEELKDNEIAEYHDSDEIPSDENSDKNSDENSDLTSNLNEKVELEGLVSNYLQEQGLTSEVKIEVVEEGILLDVQEQVLFDLGKSDIKPESIEVLSSLGNLLAQFEKDVRIVGHTDTIPISTPQYASNWELGASRSCAIVRYYIRQGFEPGRFVCTSSGDTDPIASNETAEGREQNRRVNFLIVAQVQDIKKLEDLVAQETDQGE